MISLGTGVVSVHTPLSCFPRIGDIHAPADIGATGWSRRTLLQYSVWIAAQDVPPRLLKNDVT